MMAGSEGDVGGCRGLEGETELCSHQDLVNCGGTRFECNGNEKGNVGDDLGGSYVFVSGVDEVSGGLNDGGNCDGEVKDGAELKADGGVGSDHDFVVGGDKEVDLNGEFVGKVVESAASGEVENGKVDYDGTVESELEEDSGLGKSEVTVIISVGNGELSDKSGKDVEQDITESELGKSEQGNISLLEAAGCELGKVEAEIGEEESLERTEVRSVVKDLESEIRMSVECMSHEFEKDQNNFGEMKDLGSDAELGESQEGVIKLEDRSEIDKSVKAVQQDLVVPPAAFGEGNQSHTVVSWADICELEEINAGIEVDTGERNLKDQTELNLVEESLESEIRTTESVDCVSHDLEENQDKSNHLTDLDSEIDRGVQLGSQTNAVEDKEIICVAVADDFIVDRNKDLDEIRITESVDCVSRDLEENPDKSNHLTNLDSEIDQGVQLGSQTNAVEDKEIKCAAVADDFVVGRDKDLDEIRTTESVDCVSHDFEKNQDKSKHMRDLDSEIDWGVQLGSKTTAVEDKEIICAAVADDFVIGRDEDLDECIDGSQIVDKLDSTLSDAATLCSMDKTECGETITAGTDVCAAVEHEASKSVVVLEFGAVNSPELDSNINKTYAESIGHVPAKIFGSVFSSIDDGTVSDQGPVDADCGVDLVQRYEVEIVADDTDTRSVSDQSKISQLNLGEQRSGCTQSPELNGNHDAHYDSIVPQVQSDEILQSDCNAVTTIEPEVRNLVFPITDNKSELESKLLDTKDVESRIFSVTDGTELETGVANGLSICAPNDVRSEMKIEFGTIDSAEVVTKSWDNTSLSKSQVLNEDMECNRKQAIFTTDSLESENCADMSFKSDVQYHSDINHSNMPGKDATLAECSIGDSVDEQSLGNVAVAKPFQFLAKFPRIDDDKIREQIRDTQLLVEDKTVIRDNIKCEIDITRANLQSLGDEFEATKSDERAARRLVKLKRQEIDSVQDKINRVKNSVSVMDITNRIAHMEHMIEHETRPLKEEMQLLREINVMKKLRGQISSNVCSEEEVTQALSQIEPTELQFKTLKKELGDLKNKVSKAEAAVMLIGKEYNDESKRLRELQARFRAANDIRQDAYKDLLGLKRQLHEKSKHYWMYKDDAKAASDYALNRDKEALYRLCAKQVDTFMDLWNKNDEFREDYVRCNMKSTIRRLKTLDGRSLGPDEEVHVSPVYMGEREVRQLYNPSRTTNISPPTILKQENTVQLVEREHIDGNSLVVAEAKSKMLNTKTFDNPIPETGLHIGSGQLEAEKTKKEEKPQTEEELELAMKAEISRKEEIAAKLKEQLRQEEKVKAQEALERKKRNAEKAQMRALLRAQKEAEQKEKERERRLRKKEKKNSDGEIGLELQTNQTDHTMVESKDSTPTKPSKTSHFNKYNKAKATIPLALRNRGKRRLKQFMWWIFGGLMVLFIFLVGNGGAFKNLRPRKDDSFFGNHPSAQPVWQS